MKQNNNRQSEFQKNSPLELWNQSSTNSNSQFILPRQGWQDKQALLKTIIKAKRALDMAEISNFLA